MAEVKDIKPPAARLEACVRGLGRLIATADAGVGLTEALAHGVRDPILRENSPTTTTWRAATGSSAGLGAEATAAGAAPAYYGHQAPPPRAMASLIVATIDGLSLQIATDPDAVDLDAAFGVLAEMVRDWLRRRPAGALIGAPGRTHVVSIVSRE